MNIFLGLFCLLTTFAYPAQKQKVVAFYTGINDKAHVSFVHEAIPFLTELSNHKGFEFEATNDWSKLNDSFLKNTDLVLFLDTRPEEPAQRKAFESYMRNGGAWMGFHFAGFALDHSTYPQNWDWYHQEFLGSGEYKGNTWRPTSAQLKVENTSHPALKGLPLVFSSSPNEWYSWKSDLRDNPDIDILLSIDPSSFPLGTGPKPHEIWHEGYYPVVWTNRNYHMIYINMGHNDIDYDGGTNKELSFQFENKVQNLLIINSIEWLLKK